MGAFTSVAGIKQKDLDIGKALAELQGLAFAVADGALANTKIDVAAIRAKDVLKSVLEFTISAGNVTGIVDRTSVTSIVGVQATGTITIASVLDADTASVNGNTYTFKDTPTSALHVRRHASSDATNAQRLADAVNAYENRRLGGGWRIPDVVASVASNVVTFTAVKEGTSGNSITLASSNGTRLAKSGTTLAGGTATGGISITQATTGSKILVVYHSKANV